MRRIFACETYLIAALLSATAACAQAGRGGVSGTVTDASGAVVPGASVRLLNTATGVAQTATTNSAGLYSFISLDPGKYSVTVTMQGFQTVAQQNVPVSVDQVSTVNVALAVGSTNDVVNVTAADDLAETSSSTVGVLLGAKTIERVPLLTRNVFDLVQLSAGVTPANGSPNSSSSFAITNISSGRPGVDVSSYSINGAVEGSVYFMIDGSPIGIAENNAGAIIPALEIPEADVNEFRVETQNTPASYQSGGAGVISIATKAGTNGFHGEAFAFIRPDVLAANEYFNKRSQIAAGTPNQAPSFHRYQEGGAIGGPIKKDKIFFFADYEATQQKQFDGSNYFTVPTSAERTGDFSGLSSTTTIYNPLVPDNPDGTRQAFAGNVIPNPNPIAVKFLSMMPKCNYPNPTTCDQATSDVSPNFYMPGLDPTTAQRFDVRLDYARSDKQKIFGRFSFDRLFTAGVNAFGNAWDLNYAQNVTNGRNLLVGDDLTLNANTVLQLRYSFTRHYENQGGDPAQNGTDITALGFPASLAQQEVYKTLPYVLFNDVGGGVGGTANYNTFQYASMNHDVSASLTKVVGKHELDMGLEFMKRFLNAGQPPAPSGNYQFDLSATDQQTTPVCADPSNCSTVGGSDFASFLVGMGTAPGVENTNFTKDLFVAESSPYYAAFFQDTWHPSENLTVIAGLRWDIFGGRTERHDRLEHFDPTVQGNASGVPFTGAEVYQDGTYRSPFHTNMANFGPRLSATWQARPRFVVRGGGGIYYGPSSNMVAGAAQDSDGYSSTTTWNATCLNADGNTVLNGSNLCAGAAPGAPAPSTTGAYSLSNPFPQGVVPLITNPTGVNNNLGTTLNTVLHKQRTTTVYNYNFGLEYQFPHQILLSAAYVGSRGLYLPIGTVDLNQLDLATIGKYGDALFNTTVANKWAPILPQTNNFYGSPTVPLWYALQPYPQFGNGLPGSGNGVVVHGYAGGDSEYNSLQTKLQKRLTSHFSMLASFTWAKLITDDGNPPLSFVGAHGGVPQDWRNLNLEHSISPQDVKYQFTGQASYDLPIGRDRMVPLHGVTNAVLGEWTLDGIAYLSTGIPIASPLSGISNDPLFTQRANLTCDPSKGAGFSRSATTWLNESCFAVPSSPYVAGNAPTYLDHVRTMGAQDVDLTLTKNFKLHKQQNIQVSASAFNVENRPQFGMPSTPSLLSAAPQNVANATGSPFGLINSTINTPRQFQFSGRFTF